MWPSKRSRYVTPVARFTLNPFRLFILAQTAFRDRSVVPVSLHNTNVTKDVRKQTILFHIRNVTYFSSKKTLHERWVQYGGGLFTISFVVVYAKNLCFDSIIWHSICNQCTLYVLVFKYMGKFWYIFRLIESNRRIKMTDFRPSQMACSPVFDGILMLSKLLI